MRGRPIRLNRQTLLLKPNKDYAELIFVGDVHLGYPTTNIEEFQDQLEYALKKKTYVLLMGDLLESGLTTSIGDSVYHQKLNPQEQMETMVEMLEPLAKAGLILGLHSGNHENRITNATGIDISKIMARLLNVSYLSYACWSLFTVGKIRYTCYSTHGKSGARFKHTKLKVAMDMTAWIDSDILAHAHVHDRATEPIIKQMFDATRNKMIHKKQMVCLTGSFLEWDNSYAQAAGYSISSIGSPKIKLSAVKKDVNSSL